MSIGMVGRKIGMTRVFTENGASIPVTVIQVEANRVTQVKNTEKDGYTAIQVTTGTVKQNRLNKPEKGLFAKTGVEAGRGPGSSESMRKTSVPTRSATKSRLRLSSRM